MTVVNLGNDLLIKKNAVTNLINRISLNSNLENWNSK